MTIVTPSRESTTTHAHRPAVRDEMIARYQQVRVFTEYLCEPLVPEDYVIQSMPDVSPTKWHLAHVSWFFETFLLDDHKPDYKPFHPDFAYLFNSYYVAAGERHCRPKRGLVSRPTVEETFRYRHYVDAQMIELLTTADEPTLETLAPLLEIGLHHEQQHQELMLMDIKHVFTENPLRPVYRERKPHGSDGTAPLDWVPFDEGVYWFGHAGDGFHFDGDGFHFDNEGPRHRQFLEPFALASRLVTAGEFLDFIGDGGYQRPELWLSEGWAKVENEEWDAPFYWEQLGSQWHLMTLAGMRPVEDNEPIVHVTYFEADAYARWAGVRLPTEFEWEVAAASVPSTAGNFVEDGFYHPIPAPEAPPKTLTQMYGDVWEWTRSSYAPYPGYYPIEGALGEYNGKFMSNQYVLRGGCCATSQSHIRPTYRNFFPAESAWMFSGIRLAKED